MPTNRLIQPLLNPVKFVDMAPGTPMHFQSKHMDDYFFYETIKPWEQKVHYYQKWQNGDRINLQFRSSYDPLVLRVIDLDERVYQSLTLTQGVPDEDDPDMHVYECSLSLAGLAPGIYFLKLDCGTADGAGNFPLTLISEPLDIAPIQKDTLLLKYAHYQFYNNVVFETGIQLYLRIRATLRFKSPLSKDTFFEDQPLGMSMLESKPYRLYELKIGGARGIPDYQADQVNRIFGCSSLHIDGKPYAKSDGAKMEDNGVDNYPMRGWSIDVREAVNVSALEYKTSYVLREDGGYLLREDGTSKFMRER